tara:strand:- start:156 stop:425 length:270 start_codon:yes stop_codon:yes gene_type:complete
MHHLASSVNSSIRPACGEGLDVALRFQLLNRTFQFGLNAVAIALTLPPAKSRTLVLQAQSNPAQGWMIWCRRGLLGQRSEVTGRLRPIR